MAKMSCFSALLGGRRQKPADPVADAKTKQGGGSRPRVKPVEFVEKCGDKAAPCDGADVVAGKPHKSGAVDTSPAKKDKLSDTDVHRATIAEEEAADDLSAKLKRSCSNIETKRAGPSLRGGAMAARRSRSYGDLQPGPGGVISTMEGTPGAGRPDQGSPASAKSADRVMLKKRSSSQVLPSRSRKLWWWLFLWSHRNLHRPRPGDAACGYTSDTLHEDPKKKKRAVMADHEWPPAPGHSNSNQWVAFCAENSLNDRVSAWIENECLRVTEDDEEEEESMAMARPVEMEVGEPSSGKGHCGSSSKQWKKQLRCAADEEVAQANSIVHSLNALSSVAHISGMGLKVVPMIAPFSSLRALNLSANFIVHVSPGSLPKGLHSLDLSRNKIANIEGLRELTKLRVLNLSYNRIARIAHGLSNCTAIRELYLAGNKISDVEGLHRLLKLAVLDLGFNKVTMAKALGQLVANYHSLLALNLVGNPVQANVGDDDMRKLVTGLLPQLTYLNKQPLKRPQRAREVATDSVARTALGGTGRRSTRKRASRRLSQSPGASVSRSASKGRHHLGSSLSLTARK
ncbi:uncharacterized protein LOC100820916 [Brachypodium distachyon]|uniref:Uncharacterized protein n=1 Tax=Brachypodium distachyon TaxID=15368 RepID=I1I3P0_BRADI|nr:uncharacterized protein LOC100820916 [Brachypodium distachyon]XP_014755604.1 uncharacterized protein LOC100820916 [Brachypodium distachyon]KQJ96494.1 hypothetical protein BRADI_3g23360v3 [Brachypodium distachyon]KQJ96495.1 hypothetical protein BRADI_3g23360v3 [Brachypodium distachyon]PNT67288.1 hypothetical protein BRADI_3g23360v3 [Brachypodium distachyon]PNT67289.1 hypothetical protein BRADI_3g23360v3 [Brachypodium distachyon]PNT67292.1 hypothetical protein BRADI_3g23360v3 [Brachypodium d|eukprot:XP_003571736.1 uncharacterized protein LOC100820916 [Brachypodium distachyon]